MSYAVKIRALAKRQLQELLEWQEDNVGISSAMAANDAFDKVFAELAERPTRYRALAVSDSLLPYRVAKAYYHYIAYEIVEEDAEVLILSIRHESQAPEKLLADLQ